MEQEQFVGFDVSQAETLVCVVDGTGKVLWQGRCASTPEAMVATVQRRAPHTVRIALETGPMSAWHYRSLTVLGLPMVCIDARHAKAALAMQLNKTDANDAVGLARRWCTWRLEVEIAPNPRLLCDDRLATDGIWASSRQHPVQHRHADGSLGLLGGEAAGSQPRSDQRLVAPHCRFH